MVDAEHSQHVLAGLRALGVRIAVDDYGTGYSSLAYLHELPVDELKLDRTFVTHLVTDPRAAAIVKSTVQLTHALGMVMLAEGVEDAGVQHALTQWHCDLAQGYHIARPMNPQSFQHWLTKHAITGHPTGEDVAQGCNHTTSTVNRLKLRFNEGSDSLEDDRDPMPTADAHREQGELAVGASQLVDGHDRQDAPGCCDGVSQSDAATVGVGLVLWNAELTHHCRAHGGEASSASTRSMSPIFIAVADGSPGSMCPHPGTRRSRALASASSCLTCGTPGRRVTLGDRHGEDLLEGVQLEVFDVPVGVRWFAHAAGESPALRPITTKR